jgi:peptidyl-prolyl cis-trans isomerase SurA
MNPPLRPFAVACIAVLWAALAQAQARPLDSVVAVVNKEVVVRSELEAEVNRILGELAQRGTKPPARSVLERQVLDHLVLQRLQLQLADQLGVRVDDEQVNAALQDIAQRNKLTLAQLREALAAEGMSFADFREQIRREMIITQLRQREVVNRIEVSDAEVDNFLATEGLRGGGEGRYHLAHILIAHPEHAGPEEVERARQRAERVHARIAAGEDFAAVAVEVSQGQGALEGGDLGWRRLSELPVLFADALVGLAPGAITPVIQSASGFHILRVVEAEGEGRHVIEQTHARHILIKSDRSRGEEEARARIESLARRLRDGENFADLARAHSDDASSAISGGDLGWTSPGEFDPDFTAAMDRLAPGEVSGVVPTRFGYHLIQVLERRRQDDTEAYRRSRAREVLRARKAEEQTQSWLQRMRDESYVEMRLPGGGGA